MNAIKKEIPKVTCEKDSDLSIEVLNFAQLFEKLQQVKNHNPFSFHKLQFYLILIVTKGTYQHFVDFESYDLQEGSVLFIAENQAQHFTDKISKAEGIAIVFDNAYFEKSCSFSGGNNFHRLFNYHIAKPIIHRNEMCDDNFTYVVSKLYKEFSFPDSNNKTEILYLLLKVLLLKAERIKEIQSEREVKIKYLETFNSFKNLVEDEYIVSRSSRYYATKLFISYKSLNEIVKTTTNKTVKTFIDDFVTIEIKRYLKSTSLSIKEISYKTGFEEASNLISFFKKNTGTTPLKFRKQA